MAKTRAEGDGVVEQRWRRMLVAGGRPTRPYAYERTHFKPNAGFWRPTGLVGARDLASFIAWARGLANPWYRCQELAEVAAVVDDAALRAQMIRESFAAAALTVEPNRIVTVSSWPLRRLIEAGEMGWFARELGRLIPIILSEPNPFRRQDGLFALLFSDAPVDCRNRVLDLFCEACNGPQKTLTMKQVAAYIDPVDHAGALRVALLIRDVRRRRQALRRINEMELAPEHFV